MLKTMPAMRESASSASSDQELQVVFLGTGTSSALPLVPCLTSSPDPRKIPCRSCRETVDGTPDGGKNARGNTSLVLRKRGRDGCYRNVVVDVGKTFRQQALTYFPKHGIQTIDAVILTHGHADAMSGLDDLREWCNRSGRVIPVYLNKATLDVVAGQFPYLIDASKATGGGDVPSLVFKILQDVDEFEVEGINVRTLPVHHGRVSVNVKTSSPSKKTQHVPLICLGFLFDNQFAFLSDVSHIPESTWSLLESPSPAGPPRDPPELTSAGDEIPEMVESNLKKGAPMPVAKHMLPTPSGTPSRSRNGSPSPSPSKRRYHSQDQKLPLLVIDCLRPTASHMSHFGIKDAMVAAIRFAALKTYWIGFSHPTAHSQWEELGGRFAGRECRNEAQWVDNVWEGLGKEVRSWKGDAGPCWDGLRVKLSGRGVHPEEIQDGVDTWK